MVFSITTIAQKEDVFRSTSKILNNAPDQVFDSIPSFAAYLRNNFHDDEKAICGIYTWITANISYDVENMYRIKYDIKPGELAEKTFITRKAVCQGYSELFNELCQEAGITSFVVNGYTKQNGEISSMGHAWVVARINGDWYCFDPTWGAGYILERRFEKYFSADYYMVKPEKFIFTHMPLDPMWQLVDHPLTAMDFYNGVKGSDKEDKIYAYNDTIADYFRMTEAQQHQATLRRVREQGRMNSVIQDYIRYMERVVENDEIRKKNEYQKKEVDTMNMSVNHYNTAVNLFNMYLDYFNHQFKPAMPDNKIRQMVDTCRTEINDAGRFLRKVDPFSKEMKSNIEHLGEAIHELSHNIGLQEKFLQKYLATAKPRREYLFRH